MKICIVGLGYVGLPLAIQFARAKARIRRHGNVRSRIGLAAHRLESLQMSGTRGPGWRRFWMGFIDVCCLRSKCPEQRNLLVMAIDSATKAEHEIRGSVCDRDFDRLFRPALRGHGLPFRRVGGECASFA